MPRLFLTDAAIKRLPVPAEGQVDYWDTQVRGFGLRISCGGARVFVLNRNKCRQKLGDYGPHTMTLANARQQALTLRYVASNPRLISFEKARDEFFVNHIDKLKPTTAHEQKNLMRRFPFSKALAAVTLEDVNRVLKPMPRGSARSCFNVLRTFFNWCVANDYLEKTPLKKSPYRAAHRERLLTDGEVRSIWQETYKHNSFGAIVRLLLLTGQRLSQITSLQPSWISTPQAIAFPAYIMKGNTQHTIPITPMVEKHLIFFDCPYSNLSDGMRKLRTALPDIPHWTLHDFRRYFSSTCAQLQIPLDITEAILDHRSGSRSQVQRIYDRYDRLPHMRTALERFQEHLFAHVLGEQT